MVTEVKCLLPEVKRFKGVDHFPNLGLEVWGLRRKDWLCHSLSWIYLLLHLHPVNSTPLPTERVWIPRPLPTQYTSLLFPCTK